jgi:oxalate decarboxylase/phosphoglucose isomerase-like protein (cupin superfamily)
MVSLTVARSRVPPVFSRHERTLPRNRGDDVSGTIRRVSEHRFKRSFDTTPTDGELRAEDGWIGMDVRWLLTRSTVGAEHSVFGITEFPVGSKHDIHRHPHAEEWQYLVSGHGIARVGDVDVEHGPGEVVFVPKNDYHGFENTGDEPVVMLWGYAGAASLEEAGYIRLVDDERSA